MKFATVFASAVILACAGLGGALAANLRNADEPSEFPPAGFTGMQYVDSRGCVYIRAGIDGNVTWVPRVTRGRQHICGATPTFAKPAVKDLPVIADKPATPTKPAAQPVTKPATTSKVAAAPAAPKPQPKPRTQPKPVVTIVSATTPPKLIKPVQPAPKARVVRKDAPTAPAPTTCLQASATAQKYMKGAGLRCGPQSESPVGRVSAGSGMGRSPAAAPVRTVATAPVQQPRRATGVAKILSPAVYDNPVTTRGAVAVPNGYRNVWDDDRLNPNRGPRSADGTAQMDLVWTQTVPRQLIDRASGQDVTRMHPNLRYPFINLTTQVQTDAEAARTTAASGGVVSTKSRAPVKSAPAAQPDRPSYVQAGTFGMPDNARKTALRLKQAGLPVRIWTTKRKGKDYQIVVAGPFASGKGAQAALGSVRKAGFNDAFLRR